ncbi:MAG: polysaccharide deacetylase [Segetibacter sp.]|nr:polysaccharide deacetylase [Segetibacter sp.]
MPNRQVLLTFDLEEFDIPNEYGSSLCWEEQLSIGRKGMDAVTQVLELHQIPVTIFTTAAYAQENKDQLKLLAVKNEIASHTFYHSAFKNDDLAASKLALEEITGKTVYGLRMPRMQPINMELVSHAGYLYDSSVNPTFIPGKYNNTHLPKTLYNEKEVYRLPCSVSPTFRIPLFWLAFKNFPYAVYKKLATDTINKYGYLNLYFHPWEFTDISRYKLPGYVKRHSGDKLAEKLHQLIKDLKKEGTFETMIHFLRNRIPLNESFGK